MWTILGQDHILRAIDQAIADGALAHAYLIVGPPHAGKATFARELAQAVNCEAKLTPLHLTDGEGSGVWQRGPCAECGQCRRIAAGRHADVVTLEVQEEEGHKAIRLEQVRDALHLASLRPYEGAWRVFIIDEAELLNRCQRLAFRAIAPEAMARALQERWNAPPEQATLLARLAQGTLGWAVRALQDPTVLETRARALDRLAGLPSASLEQRFAYAAELASLIPRERTAVRDTLDLWASWWRDILHLNVGDSQGVWNQDRLNDLREQATLFQASQAAGFVQLILQTEQYLDMNVNARLALEHLMLRVPVATPTASAAGRRPD
jgi:DNA polymerase-3 subunit delta'